MKRHELVERILAPEPKSTDRCSEIAERIVDRLKSRADDGLCTLSGAVKSGKLRGQREGA